MGVDVDDWKAGTLNRMRWKMQHASGFEVAKVETGLPLLSRRLRLGWRNPEVPRLKEKQPPSSTTVCG